MSLCLSIIASLRPKTKPQWLRDACVAATRQFVRLFCRQMAFRAPCWKGIMAITEGTWLISPGKTLRRSVKIMLMHTVQRDPRSFFPSRGVKRRFNDLFAALGVCLRWLVMPHLPQHDSKRQTGRRVRVNSTWCFVRPPPLMNRAGSLQHFP